MWRAEYFLTALYRSSRTSEPWWENGRAKGNFYVDIALPVAKQHYVLLF